MLRSNKPALGSLGWSMCASLAVVLLGWFLCGFAAAATQQGTGGNRRVLDPPVAAQPELPQHRMRLILKDGSYQTVLSYRVAGEVVRYRSAERNGAEEEIPLALVDLAATQAWARAHDPAQPAVAGQAAPVLSPELAREEALRAARPSERNSVLASCAELDIPACVSVAIGTDIIHAHPQADGAALGEAALTDFRMLCGIVAELLDGGVYLNFGSAVLLPEAFLKAVRVARNLGHRGDFTTADFDFIRQYRAQTNVVRRPHLGTGGRGFSFTGHHELLFPLFWQAVRTEAA